MPPRGGCTQAARPALAVSALAAQPLPPQLLPSRMLCKESRAQAIRSRTLAWGASRKRTRMRARSSSSCRTSLSRSTAAKRSAKASALTPALPGARAGRTTVGADFPPALLARRRSIGENPLLSGAIQAHGDPSLCCADDRSRHLHRQPTRWGMQRFAGGGVVHVNLCVTLTLRTHRRRSQQPSHHFRTTGSDRASAGHDTMEHPMAVRIAISGFGRIGRNVLRAIAEAGRKDLQVIAINDLFSAKDNAHLLRFDSVHGRFPGEVKVAGDSIDVGMGPIKVLAERDPKKLPWKSLDIDIVMECTGIFTDKEKAAAHLEAGAKRVLVSAPSKGADLTVVYGVNHDRLKAEHKVVSNASCTTNCLAPVAKVLNDLVGIKTGYMTTIHAYTNDQNVLDQAHKDMRRARAAAINIIPTSTGAAAAVGLVLPELKGKLDGTAIRVPVPNVSVVDLKIIPGREPTVEEINQAMEHASQQHLKGILGVTTEQLVSADFNRNPTSSTFDLTQTQIVDGRLVRVLCWYDNEWGFSNRMADTAVAMGKLG